MDYKYIYPGSFSPPTYGHLAIVRKAASLFPNITILCSSNEEKKDRWFTENECAKLWKSYNPPINTEVKTFNEIRGKISPDKIIMIRGIRNEEDFDSEKKVVLLNHEQYKIDKYFYIFSDCKFTGTSSSLVRELALNLKLEKLKDYVSPLIVCALLEKVKLLRKIH